MNEEFDVNVTFPVEYHEESLKGQPAVFKVTVKEIKERILPELDDAFAKKVANMETVDALKEDIKKHLELQREATNQQKAESAVFEKVLETVQVEIPESMISREAEALRAEYEERFSMQGLSLDNVFKSQGQDVDKVLSEEAASRIKNTLLIDKIAKAEELKLISENIKPFYVDYAKPETIQTATEFIKSNCNKIDTLVNIAGCVVAGPIEKISINEIRKQFDVNVFGHLEITQGLSEYLTNGKIINVSSMSSYGIFPFISPLNL